ncbi:MAG: CHAT domain-containing protein [Chitinophagaceae bacterium]|nr:CHAT domain-containing protein [Chitinophagaceae bacterium]
MQKKIYQFFVGLFFVAFLVIGTAQSTDKMVVSETALPVDLVSQLDSLRKTDNLGEWLYCYQLYIYEDPVKRVSILARSFADAWRAPENDAERKQWISGLAAQGYYLLYTGNILKSIDAYEQAYRFYFEKPLAEFNVLEYVLKPLGNNYTRLGDYDRAFIIQEKSLVLAKEQDSAQVASICHNLATTAIWKDDLPLAKQYCERGLEQATKNSSLHGLLLSTLSEVLLRLGKVDQAELRSRSAISILSKHLSNREEVNAPYWLRGAWQGLGDIQKERKEFFTALGSYKKGIEIIDRFYGGKRSREKAKLLVFAGSMLQQLQQPHKAIEQFDAALSLMIPSFKPASVIDLPLSKDLYGENTLLEALQGKADCLSILDKKEIALDGYMLLYDVEKKLRREFFSQTAKQQQQRESRQWSEEAVGTAYDLWKTSKNPEGPAAKKYAARVLQIAEMSKAQLLLDELENSLRNNRRKDNDSLLQKEDQLLQAISFYEKESAGNDDVDSATMVTENDLRFQLSLIQKQVKAKYRVGENALPEVKPVSVDSLLQSIDTGTTVIEFYTGDNSLYSIEAEKGRIVNIYKIENAKKLFAAIRNFVDTYFQSGPARMMNNPQAYYRDAFVIYQMLGKGIEKNKNCIIIPDGVLGYLPFDALITDSVYSTATGQWPFLIKKTNLYFNYSLQTGLQQQKIEHPAGGFAGFFISFDSSSRLAIPAVKKEYAEIKTVMRGRYFNEEKASIDAFAKQLTEVNVLHISTHSFLQGRENIPVLQLADDRFYLFELYGKVFHPQLVVLSACRTGHGILAKGEGIISLARGFAATGAGGIVAGLWDMNDEVTATLMASMYALLRGGKKPADALHEAKLNWIEQKTGQSFQKLPYYWAGLVYSGDNNPITLSGPSHYATWWLLLVGFIAIGLVFFIKKQRLLLK